MAKKHQTITLEFVFNDNSEEVCENEEDCCGPGMCDNRNFAPEDIDWAEAFDNAGGDYVRCNVLSKTPITEEEE